VYYYVLLLKFYAHNAETSCLKYRDFMLTHHAQNDVMLECRNAHIRGQWQKCSYV